jgi:hypothetical protein
MRTTIPQILEAVELATTKEQKIKTLRAYDHPVLRSILQMNFNPDIKVYLPEGAPPYKCDKEIPIGYSDTNLFAEFRRFYIWLDSNSKISALRKEQLFIQFLEGIHWTEADVIILSKDKKLQTKFKSVKEDLVRETWPDLLPAKKVVKEIKPKKAEASLGDSSQSLTEAANQSPTT